MVDVAGLVDVVELLDFEPTLACEFKGITRGDRYTHPPGCSRPAEWVGRASCCGAVELFCSPHRAAVEAPDLDVAKHLLCKKAPFTRSWTPLGRGRS